MLLTVLALANAQFPFDLDFDYELDVTTRKPWEGPIADHQIGVHPGDTPEVAAAKAAHLNAYRDILSVLPELPAEEEYEDELPQPIVRRIQRPSNVQQQNPSIQQQQQQQRQQQQQQRQFTQQQQRPISQQQQRPVSQQQQIPYVPKQQQQVRYVQQYEPVIQNQIPELRPIDEFYLTVDETDESPERAEDIPRSEIGEVPEVHYARLAHIKALQEAYGTL